VTPARGLLGVVTEVLVMHLAGSVRCAVRVGFAYSGEIEGLFERGVRLRRPRGSTTAGCGEPETGTGISVALVPTVDPTDESVRDGETVVAQQPRLRAILGRIALSLLIACFIPALLFYVCLATINVWAALVAALAWCYGVSAWRMATKRQRSGLLMLAAAVLTARTAFAIASGDTFLYFLQPAVTDVGVAAVFFASLATTRPVVARLAPDFFPMSADVAKRPRIQRLFWHLTLLWALVCLGKATVTVSLLVSQSTMTFVVVKSICLLSITTLAITATVLAAVWVARKEGLLVTA
jgi:hypothetical protein